MTEQTPQISIITATFNNGAYIGETISSVLGQTYTDWEWIIVNNGSEDGTNELLASQTDNRIHVIELELNRGVSYARNLGLERMKGSFFCFVDGDDILPPNSLRSRVERFEGNSELEFVDGEVISFERSPDEPIARFRPTFKGNPLQSLLRLDGQVFMGNSWMIKRMSDKLYRFDDNISHGEDLLFCISIASGGIYAAVDEPILYYRRHGNSAMSNLMGIAIGYAQISKRLKKIDHVSVPLSRLFKRKAATIVMKMYLKSGRPLQALRHSAKILRS